MRRIVTLSLALTLGSAALAVAAERSWLPPQVAEGVARQLAGRMDQVGLVPQGADERTLPRTRKMIEAMAAGIEARGESGLADLAPTFPNLDLPPTAQRQLGLMARYNVCNMALYRQFLDPAFRDDKNAAFTSTLGLTAVALAIIYLREPYLASGGDPKELEGHLTDPRLQPVLDAIQKDLEVRAAVEKACEPAVTALVTGAMTALEKEPSGS